MSIPIIIPGIGTRERAITDLAEAVALQKTALAHILNAEGEKIQAVIIRPNITERQMIAANDSVESMINAIYRLEMIFQADLDLLPSLSLKKTLFPDFPITPITPLKVKGKRNKE